MSLDLTALKSSGLSREELERVLEEIVQSGESENKDRIKAVELLAKLRGHLVAGGAPKTGDVKHEVVIVQTPRLAAKSGGDGAVGG